MNLSKSSEPFDPSFYTRAPSFTLPTGIVLAQALVDLCPDAIPPAVKKAAKQLHKTANAAQQAWAARRQALGSTGDDDTRLLDQEADGSWTGLRSRLLSYATLPVARFPKAKRAREILDQLFGADGLAFLRETYPVQWSTMDMTLKRIDNEGFAEDIDDLAGPEFLRQIRHVHPRYRTMVQAVFQREATGPNLLDHLRLLQRAVVNYATKICATVEDDDAASIETARDALAPIEQIRQMASSKRSSGEDPAAVPEPTTPGTEAAPAEDTASPKTGEGK